ncbi:MAG: hypothetical protein HC774_01520 [Sphingomonadales bacterium]|nr:hypothetical protein [Sphingomonadales bacterium]
MLLALGLNQQLLGFAFGIKCCVDEFDLASTFRNGRLTGREYGLLSGDNQRPGLLGGGLGLGLLTRVVGNGDCPHLLGNLQRLAPLNLQPLQLNLALNSRLVDRK